MKKFKGKGYVATTGRSQKLDIRVMMTLGQIVPGQTQSGVMEWDFGQKVYYVSDCTSQHKWICVMYDVTDQNGKKKEIRYKINIVEVPSNLGKGSIYYLECPESCYKGKVLYRAYGMDKFLHRHTYVEKYGLRIYYEVQSCSKKDKANVKYHLCKRKADALRTGLRKKHRNSHYRFMPTNEKRKLWELENRMQNYGKLRLGILAKSISKLK